MERRKELILGILIILLAFTTEFLKGVGKVDVRNGSRLSGTELKGLENHPFARSVEKDSQTVRTQNSGRGFKLSSTDESKKASGMIELGKENARGGAVAVTDKAKKKKKKKSKKKTDEPSGPKFDVSVYGKDREHVISADKPTPTYAGAANPAPATDPKLDDLQNWLKKLLARPDRELTLEFIREYQAGKLAPDVFYTVVDALLKSEDANFHELGVYCAAETPSPRSYGVLTSVVLGGSYGPAATSLALSETKSYEMLQLLWVPKNIILGRQSGSENVDQLALAANTIERSTFRYLSQSPDPNATGSRNNFYSKQAENVFKAMAPALEKAIEAHQGQASIVTPLQTALDRIKQSNLVASANTN